jgi:hypothetical protein
MSSSESIDLGKNRFEIKPFLTFGSGFGRKPQLKTADGRALGKAQKKVAMR